MLLHNILSQVSELKAVPDCTNSRKASHGRVASSLEYIFSANLLKNNLQWSEMNGYV